MVRTLRVCVGNDSLLVRLQAAVTASHSQSSSRVELRLATRAMSLPRAALNAIGAPSMAGPGKNGVPASVGGETRAVQVPFAPSYSDTPWSHRSSATPRAPSKASELL